MVPSSCFLNASLNTSAKLAMLDEDPPGAWEEAMRDLDATAPIESCSSVFTNHALADTPGQRAAPPGRPAPSSPQFSLYHVAQRINVFFQILMRSRARQQEA